MDAYPILNFLVRHGRKLAIALGLSTFALSAFVTLEQHSWFWAVVAAIGGIVVYGFVASYAELVRLVTDMLLPK